MSPSTFLSRILDPGLDWTATHASVVQNRSAARVFLLAVAIQETDLVSRFQVVAGGAGPARGWWQFEAPTLGLMLRHPVSGDRLRSLCAAAWVRPDQGSIWRAIEGHDALAVGVARLLLLTDPHPVPVTAAEGWECYSARLWRPGKPHPDKWPRCWQAAQAAVGGG